MLKLKIKRTQAISEICLFCGRKKVWRTDITIEGGGVLERVTVCPTCRRLYRIGELYTKIAERAIGRLKYES